MVWVLHFQDDMKPSYWLNTDTTYTVGRKDTDIIILQDASISRLHAHLTALPDGVRVTDVSKYGVFVRAGRKLGNGNSDILRDGEKVTLGATSSFTVRQQPLRVYTIGEASEEYLKKLHTCGAIIATSPSVVGECDIVCCRDALVPCASVLCALCHNIPIVHEGYFTRIVTRPSPKFPPPEPRTMLPEILDTWESIGVERSPDVFTATRASRSTLLHGRTLLCLSPGLQKELEMFVPLTRGKVVLDEALSAGNQINDSGAISAFLARHQDHICVVHNEGAGSALRHQTELIARLGIRCVTYASLVAAIVLGDFGRLENAVVVVAAPTPTTTGTTATNDKLDSTQQQQQQQQQQVTLCKVVHGGAATMQHVCIPTDLPCFAHLKSDDANAATNRKSFVKQSLFRSSEFSVALQKKPTTTAAAASAVAPPHGITSLFDDIFVGGSETNNNNERSNIITTPTTTGAVVAGGAATSAQHVPRRVDLVEDDFVEGVAVRTGAAPHPRRAAMATTAVAAKRARSPTSPVASKKTKKPPASPPKQQAPPPPQPKRAVIDIFDIDYEDPNF
eukprot:PhM_4_TR17981/c0_g1_i1/m.80993/K10867/NBN, NBS1; nibrin